MPSSSQVYVAASTPSHDLAVEVVGVGPQPVEQLLDPQPGLAAEGVGELVRRRGRGRRVTRSISARTQAALIANSSAPMSTIRPRKPCLVSIRPCQRDMA